MWIKAHQNNRPQGQSKLDEARKAFSLFVQQKVRGMGPPVPTTPKYA